MRFDRTRRGESGNVFFTLFGAVALVGVIGAATATLMRGPVGTMVSLNQRTKADTQLQIASKLAMLEAAQQPDSGDCDADGYIEPYPPVTSGCSTHPAGGGCIPNEIGSAKLDPWGTSFGYCAWDHGAVSTSGCNGTLLQGKNGQDATVIALISAGSDRIFQTSCSADPTYLTKGPGTDDIIIDFTYAAAVEASGGLWVLKSGTPGTATIDKSIEVSGTASFQSGIKGDTDFTAGSFNFANATGFFLPDQTNSGACAPSNVGSLRTKGIGGQILQICDNTKVGDNVADPPDGDGWVDVGGSGATNAVAGTDGQVQYNNGGAFGASAAFTFNDTTNTLSASALDVGSSLDVGGVATIDGNTDIGGTLDVTGNATAGGTLDVTGNLSTDAALSVGTDAEIDGNLIVDGNTDLIGALDVGGVSKFSDDALIKMGSAGDPGLAFSSASTTGLYYVSGGIGFTVGGSQHANVTSAGLGVTGDATATGNIIATGGVAGDSFETGSIGSGVGLFSDGAAGLTLQTAGTSRIQIDAAGDIGIALVGAPTADLDIGGVIRLRQMGATPGGNCGALTGAITYSSGDVLLVCSDQTGNWETIGTSGGGGGGAGNYWTKLVDGRLYYTTQNVGVGTNDPLAKFHVNGDFLTTGSYSGTASMPVSGAGTRMVFDSETGAFRAGAVAGTQWDDAGIGDYSFGLGYNTKASGLSSIAMGNNVSATNTYSMALGLGSNSTPAVVSGANSFGIFMGDQAGVTLADSNTMGLFGGRLVIDPNVSATQVSVDGSLTVDVEGGVGATNFCDEDGNDCFSASDIASGVTGAPGGNRQVIYNSGGILGAATGFVYTSSGQLGIGTAAPAASLEVAGTDAILFPRGLDGTRPVSPVNGMMRYNTTDENFDVYANGSWQKLTMGSSSALAIDDLSDAIADYTTKHSIALGSNSGIAMTSAAIRNVFAGEEAGFSNTSGHTNTYLGRAAGKFNVLGSENTYVGSGAGVLGSGGGQNVAIGAYAGYTNAGNYNVYIGKSAAQLADTGTLNTIVGQNAAAALLGGSSNTIVGQNSGGTLTTGNYNILLGRNIDVPAAATSNYMSLGNLIFSQGIDGTGTTVSSGNVGVGTKTPGAKLEVAGTDAILFPRGTDAERPALVSNGMMRYSSTGNDFEVYANGAWRKIVTSTGGALAAAGSDTQIQYNSNGVLYTSAGLVFTSTGRVGIGTAAPTARLELTGTYTRYTGGTLAFGVPSVPATTSTGQGANNYFNNFNNYTGILLRKSGISAGDYVAVEDYYNTPIFSIKNAGSVGIGTATPAATLEVAGTDAILFPRGGTGNRPASPVNGMMRYNSVNDRFEAYQGGTWQDILTNASIAAAPDRGIQFNSNGALAAVSTFTYTSAGNVGIGTASPSGKLEVQGTAFVGDITSSGTATNGSVMRVYTGNTALANAGLDVIRGTNAASTWTTPQSILSLRLRSDGTGSYRGTIGFTATSTPAETITLLNNGFVGINTTAPLARLDVGGADAILFPRGLDATRPSSPVNGMMRYSSTGNDFEVYANDAWRKIVTSTGGLTAAAGSDTQVQYNSNGYLTGASNLIYASNGYIGVGTSSPANILSLAASSSIGSWGAINTANAIQSIVENGNVKMFLDGNSVITNNDLYLGTTGTAYIRFGVRSVESMTLSSAGKLGINNTSPATHLDVNGTIRMAYGGESCSASTLGGMYYSSATGNFYACGTAGSWTQISTGASSVAAGADTQIQYNSNGSLAASSGFLFNSAGNVTIGTGGTTGNKLTIVSAVPDTPIVPDSTNTVAIYGNGNAYFKARDATNDIETVFGASGPSSEGFVGTMTGHGFSLRTNNVKRLTVTSGGNIGIGTLTPAATLEVAGTDAILFPRGQTSNRPSSPVNGMMRYNSVNDRFEAYQAGTWQDILTNASLAASPDRGVQFNSGGSLGAVSTFTYSSVGYLGIGTASPTAPLHIYSAGSSGDQVQITDSGSLRVYALKNDANTFEIIDRTANSGRLSILSGGNIGIGTSTPVAKLEISGTGAVAIPRGTDAQRPSSPQNGMIRYSSTGNDFEVYANSAWRKIVTSTGGLTAAAGSDTYIQYNSNGSLAGSSGLVFTSVGYVGIGTATPSFPLHVSTSTTQQARLSGSTAASLYLEDVGVADSSQPFGYISQDNGVLSLGNANRSGTATTGSQIRLSIAASGNVGVGTTSPSELMHIHAATGVASAGVRTSFTDDTSYGEWNAYEGATYKGGMAIFGSNYVSSAWRNALVATAATDNLGAFIVRTKTSSVYNDRFIITNVGNVGIGTTSPLARLQVAGTDAILFPIGQTSNRPASPVNGMMRYNSVNDRFEAYQAGTWQDILTNASLAASPDRGIQFNSGNALAAVSTFTYSSVGNVGIGTASPSAQLEVSGDTIISAAGNNTYRKLTLKADNAGASADVAEIALERNYYAPGQNAAAMVFSRGTGTDDAAISFYTRNGSSVYANRLQITKSGSVGIGTTAPAATLEVAGTGAVAIPRGTDAQRPSSPQNGMIRYSSTGNDFEVYANSAWRKIVTSTGGLTAAAGSDTYIQYNSNGSLAGSSGLVFTSVGYVGIGTATPTQALEVNGNIKLTGLNSTGYLNALSANDLLANNVHLISGYSLCVRGSRSTCIDSPGAGSDMFFNVGAVEMMRIKNFTGNVGIGTSTPLARLQVAGTDAILFPIGQTSNRPASPVNGMMRYNSVNDRFEAYQAGTWQDILTNASLAASPDRGVQFNSGGSLSASSNFVFTSGGALGIGTTSPAYHVVASGSSVGSVAMLANNNDTSGLSGFYTSEGGTSTGIIQWRGSTNGSYPSMLRVGSNVAGGGTLLTYGAGSTGIILTSSGRFGFGTATPNVPFEVQVGANQYANIYSTSASNNIRPLRIGTTGSAGSIAFARASDGSPQGAIGYVSSTDSSQFNIASNGGGGFMTFTTVTAERMRIDATGKIGIGTTAPATLLDSQGTLRIAYGGETCSASTEGSIYYDSAADRFYACQTSGSWTQIATAASTSAAGSNAQVQFNSGGSLGANSVFVWDNTNGYLGVGTANPQSRISANNYLTNYAPGLTIPGISVDIRGDGDSGGTTSARALQLTATATGSNTVSTLLAARAAGIANMTSGSLSVLNGLYASAANSGAGTVNNGNAVTAFGSSSSTGNITTYRAFYSQAPTFSSSGTIGTGYGLYLEDLKGTGGVTTAYGVYQLGATDRNYFAGKIGQGVTNPATALDVSGTVKMAYGGESCSASTEGSIYYDSAADRFYACQTSGAWTQIATAGSTSAAGSDMQIQLNNNGVLYASSGLTFNSTSGVLAIANGLYASGATRIGSSGNFYAYFGTSSTPGYTFTGGNDVGMFRPSANQLGLSTNSLERMRIDASGRVGIGTTSPSAQLEVAGTDAILFPRGGTGNRPSSPVNGMMRYNSVNDRFEAYQAGTWQDILTNASLAASPDRGVQFNSGGSLGAVSTFTYSSVGYLGIGTASPETPLHVYGTGTSTTLGQLDTNLRLQSNTVTQSGGNEISFRGKTTLAVDVSTYAAVSAPMTANGASGSTGYLVFSTKSNATDTALTERMRILQGGSVGIGTTAPAATFEVTNSAGSANTRVAVLGRAIADSNFGLDVRKGATTNASGDIMGSMGLSYISTSSGNSYVRFHRGASTTGGFMSFSTSSDIERMRIDTNGLVGINTTAPATRLDVNGTVRMAYGGETCSASTEGAIYYDSSTDLFYACQTSGSWTQISTGSSATAAGGDREIQFNSGGSLGTSSGLVYTSAARLGVGTASPQDKVHIAGILRVGDAGAGGMIKLVNASSVNWQFDPTSGMKITHNAGVTQNVTFSGSTNNVTFGINTITPAATLEVAGTDAILFPRGGTGNRPASPVNGMMRYNSVNDRFEAYQAGTWQDILTNASLAASPDRGIQFNSGGAMSASANLVYTTGGAFLLGYGTALTQDATPQKFAISDTNSAAAMAFNRYNTTVSTQPARIILGRSRGATAGTYDILQDGDQIGRIAFTGADGTDLNTPAAAIIAQVDGTPGADDMPGALTFNTTADGANAVTERMRITANGQVGIGTSAPGSAFSVGKAMTAASGAAWGVNLSQTLTASANSDALTALRIYPAFSDGAFTGVAHYGLTLADGYVGFGTVTPTQALHVYGGTSSSVQTVLVEHDSGTSGQARLSLKSTGSGGRTYNITSGNLSYVSVSGLLFEQTDGLLVNFTKDGPVGIGTTTPSATLEVAGTNAILFPRGTDVQRPALVSNGMMRYSSTGGDFEVYANGSWQKLMMGASSSSVAGSDRQVQFNSSGAMSATSTFVYTSAGSLGVGTASPLALLHVTNSAAAGTSANAIGGLFQQSADQRFYVKVRNASVNGSANNPFAGFAAEAADYTQAGTLERAYFGLKLRTSTGGYGQTYLSAPRELLMYVNNYSVDDGTGSLTWGTLAIAADASANVGIGTSTPNAKLEVSGTDAILFPRGTDAQRPTLVSNGMMRYSSTGGDFEVYANGSWQKLMMGASSSSVAGSDRQIQFNSGGSLSAATNLVYTSAGSVGIGTASPQNTLEVNGSVRTGNHILVGNPAYILMQTANGTLRITNSNGTSSSQGLTVYGSAGLIGIGTTTPAAQLEVAGTDAILLPRGTDAQRPTLVSNGMMRYSSTGGDFEVYANGSWQKLVMGASSTSVAAAGSDTYIQYNSNGSLAGASGLTYDSTGTVGVATGINVASTSTNGLQTFNTADQTTNFEKFKGAWASNIYQMGLFAGGTGTFSRKLRVGLASFNGMPTTLTSSLLFDTYSTSGSVFSFEGSTSTASGMTFLNVGGVSGTVASSSGTQTILKVGQTITQTGTAGYNALLINPTESTTGSGAKYLINAQVGSVGKFSVDTTGKVGVGTITPSAQLEVAGTDAILFPRGGTGNRPSSPVNGMMRYNSVNDRFEAYQAGTWQDILTNASLAASPDRGIQFNSGNSLAAVSTFTYTSAGNLGLGTASPSDKLHIAGGMRIDNSGAGVSTFTGVAGSTDFFFIPSTAAGGIKVVYQSGGSLSGQNYTDIRPNAIVVSSASSTATLTIDHTDNPNAYTISTGSARGLRFRPAGNTSSMFLASDGSVSIGSGTTTHAKFEVAGTDAILFPRGTDAERPTLVSNGMMRYSSTGGDFEVYANGSWQKLVMGASSTSIAAAGSDQQVQFNNNGVLYASTGLVYNSSTGRMGIATTTPVSTLDVNGVIVARGVDGFKYNNDYPRVTYWGGSSNLPTVTFDSNTGIFYDKSGTVYRTYIGGAEYAAISTTTASFSQTGALLLPRGTTGQRPGSPSNGMIRYNSTDGDFDVYASGSWQKLVLGASSTGAAAAGSTGYVQFRSSTGNLGGDSSLFWDDANKRLGVGTTSPTAPVEIAGTTFKFSSTGIMMGGAGTVGTTAAGQSVNNTFNNSSNWTTLLLKKTGAGPGDYLAVDSSAAAPVFYVKSAGQVGVGTATPGAQLEVAGTDAILFPRGTDAQRPTLVSNGMMRYSSTGGDFEVYANGSWQKLVMGASSSGSVAGSDRQIQFNSGGTLSASANLVYTSAGFLGIGTSNPSSMINTAKTFTAGTTGWGEGVAFTATGSGSSATYLGVVGTRSYASMNATGSSLHEGFGIYTSGYAANDATAQTAYGMLADFRTYPNDTAYGVYIQDDNVSTGGTAYGLYIKLDDTDVTRYGIYQATANTNYFAGNTGIGTSAPGAALEVGGTDAILFPRGTDAQRPTLVSNGMMRYSSTGGDFEVYAGGAWKKLVTSSTSGGTMALDDLSDAVTNYGADHNLAIGSGAGVSFASGGQKNVAVGEQAGANVTTGDMNTMLGYQAGLFVATGSENTLLGTFAGVNTTGTANVMIGKQAGYTSVAGNQNVYIGRNAGLYANGAGNNILIGDQAATSLVTGNNNLVLGYNVDVPTGTTVSSGNIGIGTKTPGAKLEVAGTDAILIPRGTDAQRPTLVSNGMIRFNSTSTDFDVYAGGWKKLVMGTSSAGGVAGSDQQVQLNNNGVLYASTGLTFNSSTGLLTNANRISVGGSGRDTNSVFITGGNSTSTGASNTAIGSGAFAANTSGTRNVALGQGALNASATGDSNVAVGTWALVTANGAAENTALGDKSLRMTTTGGFNTAAGSQSLTNNTDGTQNAAFGYLTLFNNDSGTYNTAMGAQSLEYFSTSASTYNTALGQAALYGVNGSSTGARNTALGARAGLAMTTGSNNILAGYQAGDAITSGSNNIVIGYDIDAPSATGSNQMTIGNLIFGTGLTSTGTTLSSGSVGIGVASPNATLEVGGTGAVLLPRGTDAQRPSLVSNGMIRFNSTSTDFDVYAGGWKKLVMGTSSAGGVAGSDKQVQLNNNGVLYASTGLTFSSSTGNLTLTNGALLAGAGSSGAPSLSFAGDSDTGLFNAGANGMALVSGGSWKMYLDATSVSAYQQFQMYTNSTVAQISAQGLGDASNYSQFNLRRTADNAAWAMNFNKATVDGGFALQHFDGVATYTTALMIDPNNSFAVGIGTVTPQAKLEVAGTGAILLPRGTDAQRPTLVSNGMMRFSSTGTDFEVYAGGWKKLVMGTSSAGGVAGSDQQVQLNNNGVIYASTGLTFNSSTGVLTTSSVQFSSATAAAPSMTFAADTDTGVFLSGANSFSVAAGGAEKFRVTTSQVVGTAGSATSAGYGFIGDTDTGMYQVSADKIGLTAAGALRMMVQDPSTTNAVATFVGTSAIVLPQGLDATRPSVPLNGMMRYSSTGNDFDVYANGSWQKLVMGASSAGGVAGSDQQVQVNSSGVIYASAGLTFSSSTGILTVTNGAVRSGPGIVTAPGLSFAGDTNTGFYNIGADSIGAATNGVLRLTIQDPSTTGAVAVFGGTSAITLPSGLDATRPSTPVNGMMRYNTTSGDFDIYANSGWKKIVMGTSSAGSVAGSDQQVQLNNNGVLYASTGLTFSSSTGQLSVTGKVSVSDRVSFGAQTGLAAPAYPTTALSSIAAATGGNTIANGANSQVWNWDSLTTGTAMSMASTTVTTGSVLSLQTTTNSGAATGNVLKIQVNGASSAIVPLAIVNTGTGLSFRVNDDGTGTDSTPFVVDASGNVGIQKTAPAAALDVVGNIQYTGTITDVSDRRLKTDIVPLDNRGSMLGKLSGIKTYSFVMKADEKKQVEFGVMAQELEKTFPELVHTANDKMGTKSVNYVGLIAPMIKAGQELEAQNKQMKAELETMKAGQDELKTAMNDLQKDMNGMKAHTGYGINKAGMDGWMLLLIGAVLGGNMMFIGINVLNRRKRRD